MSKTKILFDISHGIHGNTGIQQDMRSILSMISKEEKFEIDLLVYDMVDNYTYTDFDIEKSIEKYGHLVTESNLAYHYFNTASMSVFNTRIFGRIRRLLHQRSMKKNTKPKLLKLDKKFNEAFYRKLLIDGLDHNFLSFVKNSNILLTTLSTEGIILGMKNENYELPMLDTSDYDVAFFFQEVPIKISPNTKKIVRSYDLIQIFGPEVVFKGDYKSNYQYKSIQECIKQNATFYTISDTVRDETNQYFEGDIQSKTIGVAVAEVYNKNQTPNSIQEIIETYRKHFNKETYEKRNNSDLKYLLSVSTIEPRKNILNAYQAFKKIKSNEKYKDLYFILVGKIGWNLNKEYKNIFKDPSVITLTDVPTSVLPSLYSQAEALVYIPFQEGFGLPPAEAMRCKCPVILSDIPVHREIHGDTPFYVNHYDIDDIVKKITIIFEYKNDDLNKLKEKSYEHTKKYTTDFLSKIWKKELSSLTL